MKHGRSVDRYEPHRLDETLHLRAYLKSLDYSTKVCWFQGIIQPRGSKQPIGNRRWKVTQTTLCFLPQGTMSWSVRMNSPKTKPTIYLRRFGIFLPGYLGYFPGTCNRSVKLSSTSQEKRSFQVVPSIVIITKERRRKDSIVVCTSSPPSGTSTLIRSKPGFTTLKSLPRSRHSWKLFRTRLPASGGLLRTINSLIILMIP